LANLSGKAVLALDPRAIGGRLESVHASLAKRRAGISAKQIAKLVELEHASVGVRQWSGLLHASIIAGEKLTTETQRHREGFKKTPGRGGVPATPRPDTEELLLILPQRLCGVS
jgi:hypothetical protein